MTKEDEREVQRGICPLAQTIGKRVKRIVGVQVRITPQRTVEVCAFEPFIERALAGGEVCAILCNRQQAASAQSLEERIGHGLPHVCRCQISSHSPLT